MWLCDPLRGYVLVGSYLKYSIKIVALQCEWRSITSFKECSDRLPKKKGCSDPLEIFLVFDTIRWALL